MNHWIDDGDRYICPECGFETDDPSKYENSQCPKCGIQRVFQDEKESNDCSMINEKLVKDMTLYLVNHPIKELMELVMKSIDISGRNN